MLKNRVLVIAVDGVTFKVIRPLIEEGHLPNLAQLMAEGSSGELLSTMPPVSGPSWHAFKTGKNPGTTGVFDFLRHDPKRYQTSLIQLGQLPDPTIWDIVGSFGDGCIGVYDLPTTYPPVEMNGFLVAGFPIPDHAQDYTYPLELKAELDRVTGGHRTDIRYRNYLRHEDFLNDVHSLLDQRMKAYHFLKKKYAPELFIFAFTCTDRVQHRLWRYMDPEEHGDDVHHTKYRELVHDFWKHLDEAVGNILETTDDKTTVFILSDHGFGVQDETFYINQWLLQEGFLKLKGDGLKSKSFFQRIHNFSSNLAQHLPMPEHLRQRAPRFLSKPKERKVSYESMLGQIDWSRTRAYSPPHTSVYGTIYINSEGRQDQGTVSPRLYEELREQIIHELRVLSATTPNLQIQIFKREELYREKYLSQAPDLVYVINNWRCISRSSFVQGAVFQKDSIREDYSGTHRPEGILIVRGPEIRKDHRLGQAEIIDIVPTLLHILEIPIPDDMDGRVLKDLFEPESDFARREIRFVNAPTLHTERGAKEIQDESVRRSLEDLGYL